ncbi:MAG: hypothetical protein AABW83_01925 [Nanoarchaeota archaeon]
MKEILEIEQESFDFLCSEEDFIKLICQENHSCVVIKDYSNENNNIKGFIICENHKEKINIVNLAVHPDYGKRKEY